MIRTACPLALAMTALLVAPIAATMVVPADLGDLVAAARVIAHAHVSAVDPRTVEGARAVERVVTFQVERYFKGDLGPEIRVRVPGGTLGHYRTVTVGAPHFDPGDEVVLFLGQRESALPYIVGLSQGLYRVAHGSGLGSRVVLPAMVTPLAAVDAPAPVRRGDRLRRPTPFGEFAATVDRLVAEHAAREAAGR